MNLFGSAKVRNVAILICCFAIGQGSLFLAQTYLLIKGRVELLGEFGIALLCTTLLTQIADWGTQTLLAREALVKGPSASANLYWRMCIIRTLVSIVLYSAAITYIRFYSNETTTFLNAYLLVAGLCCFLQAFHMGGLFDAVGHSGITGAVSAAPFLVTGIAVPFSVTLSKQSSGNLLGFALLLGYAIGIVIQLSFVRKLSIFQEPISRRFHASFLGLIGEGFACLLTVLPGQLFYRSQVGAAALLGPEAAGTFLYAKQIISCFAQFSMFAIRAELIEFAEANVRNEDIKGSTITHSSGFKLSLLFSLCLGVLSGLMMRFADGVFQQVAVSLLLLSLTLITNAACALVAQWLIYNEMARICSFVIAVTTIAGCFGVFALTRALGTAGPGLAELILHICQLMILFSAANALRQPARPRESSGNEDQSG